MINSPSFIPITWKANRIQLAAAHNPLTCRACLAYGGQHGKRHPDLSVARIEA